MHWIETWCRQRCKQPCASCEACGKICEPWMVLIARAKVSGKLLDILVNGGVTHPEIARRLVRYCRGDAKAYDSIVHKRHRGKFRAHKSRGKRETGGLWAVVQIDAEGREIARFHDFAEAAKELKCSKNMVYSRCKKNINKYSNEFLFSGYSFRLAREWDAMDAEARMADLRTGQEREDLKLNVVCIGKDGRELGRYATYKEAARAMGCSDSLAHTRCNLRDRDRLNEFGKLAYTFRSAEHWDAMDAEEKAAEIRYAGEEKEQKNSR